MASKTEEYLLKMADMIKQEPENFFKLEIEDMAKTLGESARKDMNTKLEENKKALDEAKDKYDRLKAMDSVLSEDARIQAHADSQFEIKKAQDAYNNTELLIGESDTMSQFDSYNLNSMLYNWYLWTAMYMSSWVFARAVDKPASDMIRNGWKIQVDFKTQKTLVAEKNGKTITIKPEDRSDSFYSEFYKKQGIFIQDLIQAQKLARLYGGSVCGLIDDKSTRTDYETELTEINENAKLTLIVADRWQNVIPSPEMVNDTGSPDYNTPKYYTIRTDSGDSYRFHHSRVLRFTNGKAPEMIQRLLMGWGIPIGVRLYNEINRDEKIKNMTTSLLSKQSLEIIQTAGMRAYSNSQLSPEQEARLDAKLQLINRYRHFNSLLFLDKDDVYSRHEGSSVGTLAQLIDSNSRFVAGAIPMPQVLLYGDQQKGLSGNAVDDMRLYEDDLMSQRNEKMRNEINKLSKWILMWMQIDYHDFSITFNSSISYTTDEKIEKSKAVVELYRQLKDLGIYTDLMIAVELKDNQDELIFGSQLTDERIDDLRNLERPKDKEDAPGGSGGGFPGDMSELDIDGNVSGGEFDGGSDIPGDFDLDESEGDIGDLEVTDLSPENVPEPDGGIE